MRPYSAMAGVLLMLMLLVGCGQKGPLYLPGNEEAAQTYDPTGEAFGTDPEADQDNDTDAGADIPTADVRE